jgi:hypothetical protein
MLGTIGCRGTCATPRTPSRRSQEMETHMLIRADAELNRADRLKNIPAAPLQQGSGEPQVLDEKTLASQNNPHQNTDTTVRPVPHYESGGLRSKPAQEAYDKRLNEWLSKNPGKKPRQYTDNDPTKPRDGSLRSALLAKL